MATHSSVLAWRIPGTGEPGGLLSMGSHRVRHNWSNLAAAAAAKGKKGRGETFEKQVKLTFPYDYLWTNTCTANKIIHNHNIYKNIYLNIFLKPCSSVGKESAYSAGNLGLIPGSGRPPGEGNGNPLPYSCLENPKDRVAWWATVHGVTKSQTCLRAHTQWILYSNTWFTTKF